VKVEVPQEICKERKENKGTQEKAGLVLRGSNNSGRIEGFDRGARCAGAASSEGGGGL